jgi:hypothetical protein
MKASILPSILGLSVTLYVFGTGCVASDPVDGTDGFTSNTGESGAAGPTGNGGAGGAGGSTGTMMSGSTAREIFENELHPTITGTCGNCHGTAGQSAPQFLAADAAAAYTAITNYTPTMIAIPENSNFILHGKHTGPALTPEQDGIARKWLTKEADERGLTMTTTSGGMPVKTLQEALEDYASCMLETDWTELGLNNLYKQQTANDGNCGSCHSTGEGAMWLSANSAETFDRNGDFPYIKRWVSGTVDMNGNFDQLVGARRIIEKGSEPCDQEVENCHPDYSLNPAIEANVEEFVQRTMDRSAMGPCAAQ